MTDLPSGPPSKKKAQRKSTSHRQQKSEFTQEDRANQLRKAVEKIAENNDLLRERIRYVCLYVCTAPTVMNVHRKLISELHCIIEMLPVVIYNWLPSNIRVEPKQLHSRPY